MGLYSEHILPRIVDSGCDREAAHPQRRRVCGGLAGDVVEIGFGSGLNVPFYPATVTGVTAVEPADLAWKLAGERLRETSIPVQRAGFDAQALTLPDERFDAALSTWTMCTIPDLETALREIRRVLKPGGTLHFVEHGLAPDEGVRRWQHRLTPVQRRLVGGCHLDRPIVGLIERAGFIITELDFYYELGTSKVLGANSLGVARRP